MVPYSIDLRWRVVMAVDAGEESQEQIARRFSVSARWIRKLLAQRAETGSIAPKPKAGGRKLLIQGEAAASLRAAVREAPDATLEELREAIGFGGCLMTVGRSLARLKITRKKVPAGPGATRSGGHRATPGLEGADGGRRPGPIRLPRPEPR